MDPNKTLDTIRTAIEKARQGRTQNEVQILLAMVVRDFEALDQWLCKGGRLPAAWAQHFYRDTLARVNREDEANMDVTP